MECLTVDAAQLPGIVIEQVIVQEARLVICGRFAAATGCCPACHSPSSRVHSNRSRTLHDLPSLGLPVTLRLRSGGFAVCRSAAHGAPSPRVSRLWPNAGPIALTDCGLASIVLR